MMIDPSTAPLAGKARAVVRSIRERGPALVALSGGVDSSLVAALAYEALGTSAVAVTLVGPAVAEHEVHRASGVARSIGIPHVLRSVDPLGSAEYRANPSDRCFFCRTAETTVLLSEGHARGLRQYLDGVHLDDLGDDRPGLIAMERAGFLHPLVEGRFTKEEVREAARARALPNWDEPSDACLASRVRHGIPISGELLGRIEQGEALVRAAGFRRVRLRVDGEGARIEVDPEEVTRLQREVAGSSLIAAIEALGFERVRVDPHGYHGARLGASPAP